MFSVSMIFPLAFGIYFTSRGIKNWKQIALVKNTPLTKTSLIKSAGFYNVEGNINCPSPLKPEGLDIDCVWYKYRVDISYTEFDEDGHEVPRQRKLIDGSDRTSFTISDDEGTIEVLPDGADIDGETKVFSEDETPSFVATNLPELHGHKIKTTVKYLPTDSHTYVLGRIIYTDDKFSFSDGNDIFIISNQKKKNVLGDREIGALKGFVSGTFFLLIVLGLITWEIW